MTDTQTAFDDRFSGAYTPPAEDVPGQPQAAPSQPPEQPPQVGPGYDRAIEGIEGSMAERQKHFLEQQSALAPRRANLLRTLDQPNTETYSPEKVAPAPKPEDTQKNLLAFAGAMALVGAIGSKYGRMSGGAALAAFNGALQGWQAGNLQVYEMKTKEWEENTKRTIENNAQELQKYRAVLENKRLNIEQQSQGISLIAAEHQDQLMFDAAKVNNYTMIGNLVDKKERTQAKLQESFEKLKKQRGEGENVDGVATAIAEGRMQPLQGYALRSEWGKRVMEKVAEINPTYDATAYYSHLGSEKVRGAAEAKADSSTLTKLTQQQSAIRQFENTAIKNGDRLVELARKVDKTGVPVIERWARAGRQATGDADVSEFMAQMKVYTAEVAKIISNPNLTGVLSDTARRETQEVLPASSSVKQIERVVGLLRQDFDRRSSSLEEEISRVKNRVRGKSETEPASAAPAAAPSGGDGWGKAEIVK